jgi:hypothetical protein
MTDNGNGGGPGISPYDTAASSGLRFSVEVIAWIAGPMAAAELTGSGWAAIPALVVLVAIPAVFSTPGDKKQIVVATPGRFRVLIEFGLHAVAAFGAFVAWPTLLAVVAILVICGSLLAGTPRMLWLLGGAPPVEPGDQLFTSGD